MIRSFLLLPLFLTATIGCASEAASEASPEASPESPTTAAVVQPSASPGAADSFDEGVKRVGPPAAHIALTESGTKVSVEECRDGCRDHAECVAWSWRKSLIDETVGMCRFSKVEGEQEPDERSISGVIAGK